MFQKVLKLETELAKKNPKLQGEYATFIKYNGWFVAFQYTVKDGWQSPISSAGRTIPSFEWMKKDLNLKLPKLSGDAILIAEAIIPEVDFFTANGIFNRSVGDYSCKDAVFMVHDLIYSGTSEAFIDRYNNICYLELHDFLRYLKVAPILLVGEYNKKLWDTIFYTQVDNGEEGIIHKRISSLYLPGKRNSDMLKQKMEVEIDLLAVRLEKSIGKQGEEGLTLISRRANGVEVSTVINNLNLKHLWLEDDTKIIGKVVQIRGMQELENGNIYQPVFVCIRYDKNPSEID